MTGQSFFWKNFSSCLAVRMAVGLTGSFPRIGPLLWESCRQTEWKALSPGDWFASLHTWCAWTPFISSWRVLCNPRHSCLLAVPLPLNLYTDLPPHSPVFSLFLWHTSHYTLLSSLYSSTTDLPPYSPVFSLFLWHSESIHRPPTTLFSLFLHHSDSIPRPPNPIPSRKCCM